MNTHLIVFGTKYEHVWSKVDKDKICQRNNVKLLGVKIDNKLKFDEHITHIFPKANRKLSALTRLSRFLFTEKRRIYSRLSHNHNLSIIYWYGCFTEDKQTIKLTGFMSVFLEECTVNMCHLLRNYWIKIIHLQFTIETSNLWRPKHISL